MITNYFTAVNWLHNSFVLLNNIHEIDPDFFEAESELTFNQETEEYTEIYQYFICDCSDSDVEFLRGSFPDLLFAYSDILENWVLLVDHYGTSWDYVETTTTLNNAVRALGER